MARYSEELLGTATPPAEPEKPPEETAAPEPRAGGGYSQLLLAPPDPEGMEGFARRSGEDPVTVPVPRPEVPPETREARRVVQTSERRRQAFAKERRGERGTGLLPTVGGFVEDVGNIVRGQPQYLEPEHRGKGEIGFTRAPDVGTGVQVGAGLSITTDPVRQLEIIRSADPGAEFKVSERGNILVKFSNQSDFAFLNKPGLTGTDAVQGLAQIAQFAGGAKLAGGLVKRGVGKRALSQAGAAATVSVGQDVAAQQLGSEEPIDPIKAGLTALFGGGAELAAPAVVALWRRLPFRQGIVNADGTLTEEGAAAARRAGIEPGDIAPEVLKALDDFSARFSPKELERAFAELARQTERRTEAVTAAPGGEGSPSAAVRTARARQFGIDLMEPQATRSYRGLARLQEASRDMQGEAAGRMARERISRQTRQQQDAADRLISRGERTVPLDPERAAQSTVEAVRTRAGRLEQEIRQAYSQIAGRRAHLRAGAVGDFAVATGRFLRSPEVDAIISRELTPGTWRVLQKVRRLSKQGRQREREFAEQAEGRVRESRTAYADDGTPIQTFKEPTPPKVEFRRFERLRREINQYIDRAQAKGNREDVFYLTNVKRRLDQFIDDAFDNALFEGDQQVLRLMKQARAKRQEYGELFEARQGDNGAGRIIDKMINQDVTNRQAANWIFGASRAGESTQAVLTLKRLRKILGPRSREWRSLKQAYVQRILYGPRASGGLRGPQAMSTDLREATAGRGQEATSILFNPKEVDELYQFGQVLEDLLPPPDVRASSGTAERVSRALQDAAGNLLTSLGFMSGGIEGGLAAKAGSMAVNRGRQSISGRTATRAATKALPPPRVEPLFQGAAVAGQREAIPEDPDRLRLLAPGPRRLQNVGGP